MKFIDKNIRSFHKITIYKIFRRKSQYDTYVKVENCLLPTQI